MDRSSQSLKSKKGLQQLQTVSIMNSNKKVTNNNKRLAPYPIHAMWGGRMTSCCMAVAQQKRFATTTTESTTTKRLMNVVGGSEKLFFF